MLLLANHYYRGQNLSKAYQWADLYLGRGYADEKPNWSGIDKANMYFHQRQFVYNQFVADNSLIKYETLEHTGWAAKENLNEFVTYYYNRPLSDWKKRAEILDVPVGYLLQFPRSVRVAGNGKLFYDNVGVAAFDSVIEKNVKQMLSENDPDAMNAWGVMLAKTNDPKAVEWITKAAKGGSAWGIYNLTAATKWGLPGYGEEQLPAAQSLQSQLIAKASKRQLMDLIEIYKTLPQTWEKIHADLIIEKQYEKAYELEARVKQMQ